MGCGGGGVKSQKSDLVRGTKGDDFLGGKKREVVPLDLQTFEKRNDFTDKKVRRKVG